MNPIDVMTIFGTLILAFVVFVSARALVFIHRMNRIYGDWTPPKPPTD